MHEDPLEPVNRPIFEFNLVLDRILLKPMATVYVTVLPEDGRETVRRMLDNMKEPTVFFNDVLQGDLDGAGITLGRLVVNTTLGVGGAADVARKMGLPRQTADFGQTLHVWGLPEGPYLVLPVFGPSNPRDAIGMGLDSYADPVALLAATRGLQEISIGRFVADGLDQRARNSDVLDDVKKNSLDYYAELRSLSQQHRDAELRKGEAAAPAADFYADPGSAAAKPEVRPAQQQPQAKPRSDATAPFPRSAAPVAAAVGAAQPGRKLLAADPDQGPLRGR